MIRLGHDHRDAVGLIYSSILAVKREVRLCRGCLIMTETDHATPE